MVTVGGKRWIMKDDLKAAFNIFCCMYGVGTLGMPGNFSRAGPAIATVALLFMAFANIYASVCMSRVLLLAPKTVKTFSDLGEWCMGKWGRWLASISHMSTCILTPCVFLVLGGSLLDGLFPNAFSQSVWIIFMTIMVLPVCFIPTLKEGAGAAFAGCIGTITADVIGVAVVMHGMRGHPSVIFPHLTFKQVAGAFGNLGLAFGCGIVLVDVQRQHSIPTRMPTVTFAIVMFVSALFLTLATTGYSAVGCQISGNLLFTIYPDATTGLTSLGFKSDWGAVVMAYLLMQLHITIAFSVIVNPAFFIAERIFLGMHKHSIEEEAELAHISYAEASTPNGEVVEKERRSKYSHVSFINGEEVEFGDAELEAAEYRGSNAFKYVLLRLVIVIIMAVVSILLRDHFSDLGDFVGASCITVNCILLPIVFWYIKAWNKVAFYEKVPGFIVLVVCFVLGCYVTYTTGQALFTPTDSTVNFPFCPEEYQMDVYYNYTAVHGSS